MEHPIVDVAINYYGKPYQTMVTIGSLLEHCGHSIGTIFLIVEPRQPAGGEVIFDLLRDHDWPVKTFTPKIYLGWGHTRIARWLGSRAYGLEVVRHSIRYQYALEMTDRPYILLTHNDMRFTSDVIGPMVKLATTGGRAGVGEIGACWKCPALEARLCTDHGYHKVALTAAEWVEVYRSHPSPYRGSDAPRDLLTRPAPPLPSPPIECRLNEWVALIDVELYRREVKPRGAAEPIGSYQLGDVGIAWFRDMVHRGHSFAHYSEGFIHGKWSEDWAGGHPALFDSDKYASEESEARAHYQVHYA